MWAGEGAAHAGAAKRRRKRRHLAYLKYVLPRGKSGAGVFLLFLLPSYPVASGAATVQAEHECRRHSSVYGGFWKYFVFLVACSRCSHVSTEHWILREMTLFGGAMLGSTVDTLSATVLAFRRISHSSHAQWRSVLSRCFSLSSCCAARIGNLETLLTASSWLTRMMMRGRDQCTGTGPGRN